MPPVRTQVEKRNFWKWHTAKRYLAILNLEASNYWKNITFGGNLQKNTTKPSFFWLLTAWWSDYHLYLTWKSAPCSQLESSCFRNQSVKKCNKRSKEKILTQIFTFWALTKIHSYCPRNLKSTGDHICLEFWIFRFDLRKKKRTFANQTTENEIWHFWTSKCQPAQSGKVFKGLFYPKKTVAREKLDTESMDEWSLEQMKEQDPRWERVERSFW